MKLTAELDGEKIEIEIKTDHEKVSATIAGRSYQLSASEVESDVYLLKHDNKVYQIYVAPDGVVRVGNHQFEIKVSDPKRLRGSVSSSENADEIVEIRTAMPGKIVRVLARQGAEIKQGESVLIVEAMKMQNEMKSPKDGTVKEIRVGEGATVQAGDILAIIE